MITIVDYKMGNIRSVINALDYLQIPHVTARDAAQIHLAERLLLPGVGNFAAGMAELTASGAAAAIIDAVTTRRTPLLGICLGMQLLAERGMEGGEFAGLGLIPGTVRRMTPEGGLKVPHMGWSNIRVERPASPLYAGITPEMDFYFVHSYHFDCPPEYVGASFDYGGRHTAAVEHGRVYGVQFHPEKSQRQGLHILKNFAEL